jgi:alkanesulfonate monooxygenase SsuD/methylene tetrahydromethanopterin reductase-like flavin-dependent oxidoreductase (luciferase family)
MTSRVVRFGVWADFRNPAAWAQPVETLYRELLDQAVWAEGIGFDAVWLSEHHLTDDGYSPSPLVLLGAIAARTTRLRLGTNLIVAPLHDPVRLAEDTATLTIVSGGRVDLGIAGGYRALEFAAFGRELAHRPSLMEETVAILRRAWAGESLAFAGRRYSYPDVRVTPVPPHPPRLLMGGHAAPALERVARLADGYLIPYADHFDAWDAACARVGRDPATVPVTLCDWPIIAPDPEAVWARIAPHAVYQLNAYLDWEGSDAPRYTDAASVLERSAYRLLDADGAVAHYTDLLRRRPALQDLAFWGRLPGEPVESGSARLAYVAAEVLPRLRAEFGSGG